MRLRERLLQALAHRMTRLATRRPPDLVVGDAEAPYLRRWWVIPRNRLFNIYLHEFRRSDDDRALHDHPWVWCSLLLRGRYIEHTIAAGGIHRARTLHAGSLRMHGPHFAHRIELLPRTTCWTLFITGPRLRTWGFHCPQRGWVPWRRFTDPATGGSTIGRGCEG